MGDLEFYDEKVKEPDHHPSRPQNIMITPSIKALLAALIMLMEAVILPTIPSSPGLRLIKGTQSHIGVIKQTF